jgi:YegS/Rv2252/BmrU family lipid kinase
MRTLFILNPNAGRNRRRPQLRRELETFVRRHRLDAAVALTSGPGHATELARTALRANCRRVVAVGGDGTMNEVAQGLVGTPGILALVPCGSGNGLALHLRLPTRLERALDLLVDPAARPVAIDTGLVNGHPFFNAMGLGFDAEISRRFNQLSHRGLAAYVRLVAGAVGGYRPERVEIATDRERVVLDAALVAVANSDQYGNNAFIAPGASVHDGRLDLTAIPAVGLLGSAAVAVRLFAGTLGAHPGVVRRSGAAFTLRRERPGLIHTDGETHDTDSGITVAVRPASLHLLVPAATAARLDAARAAPLPALAAVTS